jgi:hypothetical protein
MAADPSLAEVRDDARHRVPSLPSLGQLIDDAGRQRLAAYYLYSAVLAGLLVGDELAPAHWPARVSDVMQRLGLAGLAPRTRPGLDAQLTPAQQDSLRRRDRQSEFARLLVSLINQGAFGPLCGAADSVRLTEHGHRPGRDLELIKDGRGAGTCKVADHWELVAQHLAGLPLLAEEAEAAGTQTAEHSAERRLKETGISHAVSLGITLAVSSHPLGAAAGLGTRLVRARLQTDRDEARTLGDLGEDLSALAGQASSELAGVRARRTASSVPRARQSPGRSQ